ncbi:glycosyltransferase family 4 protein [Sphingosinicella microcystinivorans]|uniref:glycosyltransferase family 4 protein n=1 Tax=Sphingosinicella microcystinivorans TaxID=335406 RepID=UPI0022F3C84E|nr:glycosyltransferase family 4 protein [Sphingosinicella microcystinivorans]WBX84776.1 glycosyltransferase family 4 protein [Sphingosinicella microcystinivorans]
MKIAVISNGALSLINFRGHLMAEMIRRGHEVLAFAPDHDEISRTTLRAMGVRPVECEMARAGTNPLQEMASILELHRLLRRHQPDLCFSYFIKPVIYGTIAAWMAKVPRRYGLIEGLGFAFTVAPGQGRQRRLLQGIISTLARFAMVRLDRLMFLNPDDLQEFVTRKLITRDKAALVGAIGVDLNEWSIMPLPRGPVTFILVARLLRDKGVVDYIDAARILRTSHPDARFLLVGGLDDNPAAISHADVQSWVDEGLIEWPGHVSVEPWLARAHVFVLPSYREGVPRSTQEAMAMGRPVVTTDAPGCRETVIDGQNGFMVPPRDPQTLAAAMRRFLVNPDLIARMGTESRRLAEERFDVNVQNRKILDCMGVTANERRPE